MRSYSSFNVDDEGMVVMYSTVVPISFKMSGAPMARRLISKARLVARLVIQQAVQHDHSNQSVDVVDVDGELL